MVHRWLVLVLALTWLLLPTAAPGQAVEEEETESHTSSAAKPVQRAPALDLAAVAERILSRTNAFRHSAAGRCRCRRARRAHISGVSRPW
jgi:hypothetical protein